MERGPALTPARDPRGAAAAGRGNAAGSAGAGPPDLPVDRDPQRIAAMFGAIAARYDLMNRLMTLGMDGGWRRRAALAAGLAPGERVLDACCGTGDLALALGRVCPGCEVVGLDFTAAMLARAREKAAALPTARLSFVQGDLLHLPFADGEFAAVTVGWGVRNVPDVPRAFAEMKRVTRPGGRVVCLESTQPPGGLGRRPSAALDGSPGAVAGRPRERGPLGLLVSAGLRRILSASRRAGRHHGWRWA